MHLHTWTLVQTDSLAVNVDGISRLQWYAAIVASCFGKAPHRCMASTSSALMMEPCAMTPASHVPSAARMKATMDLSEA